MEFLIIFLSPVSFLVKFLVQYRFEAVMMWKPMAEALEFAFVAQMVERVLGKNEVSGPIPDEGSVSDI